MMLWGIQPWMSSRVRIQMRNFERKRGSLLRMFMASSVEESPFSDFRQEEKEGRITIFSTHIMDLALDLCDEIVLLNHGELERVDKADLDSHEFKEKIIAALREEEHE